MRAIENGVFKKELPLNQDTLFEANLCLAIVMLRLDKFDVGLKLQLIRKYFYENFPENYSLFDDRLAEYYKVKNIDLKSISEWLNKKVLDYSTKYHILYFLARLSMKDGEIIDSEYELLKELTRLLELKESDLESILNTYKYYEYKNKQENDKKKATSNVNPSSVLFEIALKVLNLKKGATIKEAKSAYRKLAMLHHPDKFSSENEMQQKIAHERFVKINEAYELVLENFK